MNEIVAARCEAMRGWFGGRLGERLLETERSLLNQLLAELFGYHLLQLSVVGEELHRASPVGHKVHMGWDPGKRPAFVGDYGELPFANDSLDVVLLHHVLEISEAPTQILREASRVTIPSGNLVIVGFNPVSSWGAWKLLRFWDRGAPFAGQFLRSGRLLDWLTLLDFRIDRVLFAYYRPPSERLASMSVPDFSQGLSRRLNWPFGAVYAIVARKQVAGMTPIRPRWRSGETALANLPVAKPAGRQIAAREMDRGSR